MSTADAAAWTIIVPVKGTPGAKSRLGGEPTERAALASAIALDTIAAVISTPGVAVVVVVTGAAESTAFERLGARIVRDDGEGLGAAVGRGIRSVDGSVGDGSGGGPVGILLGDLPALAPAELAAVLERASEWPRAFVADADGVGTTLITANGVAHEAAFGGASRAAHLAAGYVELDVDDDSGLRRDVDTRGQLLALAHRLGPHTRAQLRPRPVS